MPCVDGDVPSVRQMRQVSCKKDQLLSFIFLSLSSLATGFVFRHQNAAEHGSSTHAARLLPSLKYCFTPPGVVAM